MESLHALLPVLLQPRNLIILTIVFLLVYWLMSTLKFISSLILKVLIALLIVTIVAYFLGIESLVDITTTL